MEETLGFRCYQDKTKWCPDDEKCCNGNPITFDQWYEMHPELVKPKPIYVKDRSPHK